MSRSLNKDIAKVVRALLATRGLHQKDLAQALGHHNGSNVSRWLKGGTFDVDTIESMAAALGLEPDELVRVALLSRKLNDGELSALLASMSDDEGHTPNPGVDQEGNTGS